MVMQISRVENGIVCIFCIFDKWVEWKQGYYSRKLIVLCKLWSLLIVFGVEY